MSNRGLRACGLLVTVTVGCARHGPASGPTPTGANATRAIADSVVSLSGAVARSRASLDSVVHEVHRMSGDTSVSSVARSRQLRRRAISLDSTYRANLAEFLWTVNAATTGVLSSSARFSVDAPPAPLLRAFADGSNWMIQSPLIHEIGKNSPHVVIVPRGFVTDFASIPQPLQILRGRRPTTGRYGNAAVVHDYLYWRQDCTRVQADKIMEMAMMDAGVPLLERKLIYEGVRQFGQSAWDGNRRARQDGLIRTVGPPHDQVPPTGTWAEYREWLRTTRAKEGIEYRVHQAACTMADSVRAPN